MTDRLDRSREEKNKLRNQRYHARKDAEEKLGRKLRANEQVDHVKPKLGACSYDNSCSNLKVVTKGEHKKKMKNSKSETGGRPRKGG